MKTKYLKIVSQGEIENGAITLIGATTKRGDSTKIGYYGSGLKYSISSMIRNDIHFKIFSGEREVKITTEVEDFRGQTFETIVVDGARTSLTTLMGGKDWDNSFSPIREIYSNALDEDEDAKIGKASILKGEKGLTTFLIEMTPDVEHFYNNVHLYFCNQNPKVLEVNEIGSIYDPMPNELRLFRKNILCYTSEERSVFNYNSSEFPINESRVLSSLWQAKYTAGKILKRLKNETMIRRLLNSLAGGNSGCWEHGIDWSSFETFTNEWFDVMKDGKYVPAEMVLFLTEEEMRGRVVLPNGLLKELIVQFPDLDILGLSSKGEQSYVKVSFEKVSEILINKVVDAVAMLNKTRYRHRMNDINIQYAKFTDEDVFGMAEKGVIYLSVKLDTFDTSKIAKIIIEENEHNITGFGDCTRRFQTHLFDLFYDELTN